MTESLHLLFVCTANICRSPFMELYTRQALGDGAGITVSSAGTHGWVDHPMNPEMAAELEGRGVDTTGFRSRPLTAALIDRADLVLTAERSHRQFILDDHAHAFRKVLTVGQAVHAAGQADRALPADRVLDELARHRGMAGPEHDVDDPYGRGKAAAAAAAVTITAMLDDLLTLLAPLATSPGKKA